MRRFLCLGLVLFFFAPFAVEAQGAVGKPYARYCPDPTQIFTGVAYDDSGNPESKLSVSRVFEEKIAGGAKARPSKESISTDSYIIC